MNLFVLIISFTLCLNVNAVPLNDPVHFYHYANDEQINGQELKTGDELSDDINLNLPWKFFVHGWTTNHIVSPWYREGKEAYFRKGSYNLIFVDWSKLGNQTYLESVRDAPKAGEYLGKFILYLVQNGVPMKNVHLLGHSLGAQMVAHCAKYIIKTTNGEKKLGRITGMDPAGPVYELNPLAPANANKQFKLKFLLPPHMRLDKTDAHFVDVIHTDGGQYGMVSNVGHVDFHPNGGKRMQPGCETTDDENCSHARSTKFFVESINNDNFVSTKCDNYDLFEKGCCENNEKVNLGEYTSKKTRGVFYLHTNAQKPYAKGPEQSINKCS